MEMIVVVGVCGGLLLIGAMRRHAEWLLNFVLRMVLGTLAILFINAALQKTGCWGGPGLNPTTVLTCGFLGFPGVAALYGIYFYKTL